MPTTYFASPALVAKVAAINRCHKEAKRVYAEMVAIFAPLMGQKLDKADGSFLEKIRKLLPQMPNSARLQVYRMSSGYSLGFNVKTCEMIEGTHGCLYHEIGVYVGDMNNGVLVKMYDKFSARDDYTIEEVLQKRNEYGKAKEAFDAAQSALHPFGEHDR